MGCEVPGRDLRIRRNEAPGCGAAQPLLPFEHIGLDTAW